MENTCSAAPPNKKEYISDIAKILVKEHGKKKFYKPEEVKKAHNSSNWFDGTDFSCWGMSTFSSRKDFNEYHQSIGENCDYVAMKSEMLQGLTTSDTGTWLDISNLDIDASWLDFGDVFGGILDGIGDLIGGIIEGVIEGI